MTDPYYIAANKTAAKFKFYKFDPNNLAKEEI